MDTTALYRVYKVKQQDFWLLLTYSNDMDENSNEMVDIYTYSSLKTKTKQKTIAPCYSNHSALIQNALTL